MGKKNGLYQPQFWETKGDTRHWTRLFDDMITSPAFISLTPDAKILYLYLKREYKGAYNDLRDTVIFPYTQAVKLTGIRKGNIKRCIEELERFGFIKTEQIGGLYRVTNQYTLVKDWKDINEVAAKAIKAAIKEERRSAGRAKQGICDF